MLCDGAAGLDLCLHLVRRDFGAAVAADAGQGSRPPAELAARAHMSTCRDKQSPCGTKNERGSANRVRRVEDESGRRFRLRDHCDMRRINLDDRCVRHESLRAGAVSARRSTG